MIEFAKTIVNWLVPPVDHDELTQYLWRVRIAFFGCISFALISFSYTGMTFGVGPDYLRPASVLAVKQQVESAKGELSEQVKTVQSKLDTLSANQYADRVERLDQQLLWYRTQNCKVKSAQAKQLYLSKIQELAERYRAITGNIWQMPACSDVGAGVD